MRMTLKISPRFSARRIAQGGATFAAFGALSLAAAMPAAADTTYGWGYATATGGAAEAVTDVTQSGSASGTTGGVVQVDDCFSLDAETTATVGANGVTATTVINSASIELTQECFDDLPEEEAPEPSEVDEDDETDTESEAPEETEEPEGEGDDTDTDAPEETEEPEGEGDTGNEDPVQDEGEEDGLPTEESQEDTGEQSSPPVEGDAAEDEVVALNDETSTTVSATGDVVASVSVTGASVTTTQSWDGDVDYSLNRGSAEGGASVYPVHYVETFEDEGVTWNDGITDLYVTFTVEEAQVTYYLGTTAAAVATVQDGEPGGDNPGDGDEQNPPARDDEPKEQEPEPKSVEPLPQTGSPIIGLVGAGAAIAVGGGAAAFLARRKKTAATAEENGEG